MAVTTSSKEVYAQFAYSHLSLGSLAGVSNKIETGLTTLTKIAWEISAIEIWTYWDQVLNLNTLGFRAGLSSQPLSVVGHELGSRAIITAIDFLLEEFAKTQLGGGGDIIPLSIDKGVGRGLAAVSVHHKLVEPMLVVPQSLYVFGIPDQAITTPDLDIDVRVWYRNVELKDSEYWDLVQLLNPLGM
jgi:hypothetical protein